jgi:hypothetical protein
VGSHAPRQKRGNSAALPQAPLARGLLHFGYPPDLEGDAIKTVVAGAELLAAEIGAEA